TLRRFANAHRGTIGTRHDLDIDRGPFRATQNWIGLPAITRYARPIEAHRLLKRPTGRLNRAAFDLIRDTVRVNDETGVDGDDERLDCEHGRVGAERA